MKRRSFLLGSAAAAGGASGGRGQSPGTRTAMPQFQLGCVTYDLLKDVTLESLIQILESAGIAAVELRTGHKHGVEPSLNAPGRELVRARFQRSKVRLLSYGSTCEFQSPDEAERQRQ